MTELELLKREETRLNEIINDNRGRQREIQTELFEKKHGVKKGDVVNIKKKGYSSDYTGRIISYVYGRDCSIARMWMCKITKSGADHSVKNEIMLWGNTEINKV